MRKALLLLVIWSMMGPWHGLAQDRIPHIALSKGDSLFVLNARGDTLFTSAEWFSPTVYANGYLQVSRMYLDEDSILQKATAWADTLGREVLILPARYEGWVIQNELVRVRDVVTGLYGFWDLKRREVLEPLFYNAGQLSQGLIWMQNMVWDSIPPQDRLHYYINLKGKARIRARYPRVCDFAEGRARVQNAGGRWGYLDLKGRLVIDTLYTQVTDFCQGEAVACTYAGCGILNQKGQWVIPPDYCGMGRFQEGLAPVCVNGRWGYINRKNELVISPQYSDARGFFCGRAAVEIDEEWGYINAGGAMVIMPTPQQIGEDFHLCRAWNGRGSYMNEAGEDQPLPPAFDKLYDLHLPAGWPQLHPQPYRLRLEP
ncbi:MAG: WG repeat-containing protein [Bacteroidetes bacterium]|nr:WG repeat-containing protein [Bacteroidota bacterium]